MAERWKEHLPTDYLVKEAFVDRPSEEDACHCHFTLVQESTISVDSQLVLRYQWFVGDRTPTNFTVIPDATGEVIGFCVNVNVLKLLMTMNRSLCYVQRFPLYFLTSDN